MTEQNPEYERLLAEERLILNATEMVTELMQQRGITRAELAKRVNKTRGFITQLLSGDRNMTLRTLAAMCHALDSEVRLFAQTRASSAPATTFPILRGTIGQTETGLRAPAIAAAAAMPPVAMAPVAMSEPGPIPDAVAESAAYASSAFTALVGTWLAAPYMGSGVPTGNLRHVTTFTLELPWLTDIAHPAQSQVRWRPPQNKPQRRVDTRIPTAA